MNLTIEQIQDLSNLDNKVEKIKELNAHKASLQNQISLSYQSNQAKLKSTFDIAFNNALTSRSQSLTAQKISDLANWETQNAKLLNEKIKIAYTEFLYSPSFVDLIKKFIKKYELLTANISLTHSADLEGKLSLRDLNITSSSINNKLDPLSVIIDFGEVFILNLSFDSVKEDLVPILISRCLAIE